MSVFRMPSLGADMEAGTLVEWLKKPGDPVKRGDIIAVVETQKGAIEIEVFESGAIETLKIPIGATVPVGAEMAVIRAEGEAIAPREVKPTPEVSTPVSPATPRPAISPTPATIPQPAEHKTGAEKSSPAARKFATDHGIDLSQVQGSGPDGAILYVDVETTWQHRGATASAPLPGPPEKPKPTTPSFDAMRTAIAAAMARSKREIPHYYLGHSVDVTVGMDWLARRNAERAPKDRALFAALLLKAIALSLEKFPEFNGIFQDGRFKSSPEVHMGMAIALRGGGLIAPAIHDTGGQTLDQLMSQLRDLTNRVRAGRFRSSELADPTVTLTSLGERGVDRVQPIIYPPQVAIIGAGSPELRPWIADGQIVPRQICELSLAADHRVSDGHRGALLLRAIAARLQTPEAL